MTREPHSSYLDTRNIHQHSLFDGRLICRQYEEGYRFSIDSVLLAHYPRLNTNEKILDLGAGTGVIGLILCFRYPELDISITGIELQADLAALARENIISNGFDANFTIIEGDVGSCRAVLKPESFSLIISNPPFYTAGSGRRNEHPEALIARHQNEDGLQPFIDAAAFSLQNKGRAVFIYPADKVVELLGYCTGRRLNPKSIQFIYSYPEADAASLVVIEAVKNGGTTTRVKQPLTIFDAPGGDYTLKVQSMFDHDRTSPVSDAD